jgi:predicted ATPase
MKIIKVTVEDYKSFGEAQDVKFSPGVSVIVGSNNAGKTALLELLSGHFDPKPHRSLETMPTPQQSLVFDSKIHYEFEIQAHEVWSSYLVGGSVISFMKDPSLPNNKDQAIRIVQWLTSSSFLISCTVTNGELQEARAFGLDRPGANPSNAISILLEEVPELGGPIQAKVRSQNLATSESGLWPYSVASGLIDQIFYFHAERYKMDRHQVGPVSALHSDASDLPRALNLLQTKNRHQFDKIVKLTRTIFPDIRDISVPVVDNTIAEIRLWSVDSETERDDLTVSLKESGNGISQVLAVLYVVATAVFPRAIIIDEPQSFLHPSAIRKLIRILKTEFSQHQYILTTHSPIVVSASAPSSLVWLHKPGSKTRIEYLDPSNTRDLRSFLADVGVRFSDVFGADRILWVEGRTEELAFPEIVSDLIHLPMLGTEILAIDNTGDIQGRHAERLIRIYRKLTTGGTLLPPALAFVLDSEGKSQSEKDDLKKRSTLIRFLPRRMYENYLLNSSAIHAIISSLEGFSDDEIDGEVVSKWIDSHRLDAEFWDDEPPASDAHQDDWLIGVHGARLLSRLFKELSNNRYEYEKVEYGLELTRWKIRNEPSDLEQLARFLSRILESTDG